MLFKGTKTLGSLDWDKEKPLLDKINTLGAQLDTARQNGGDEKTVAEIKAQLDQAQAAHKDLVVSEIYSTLYSSEGGVGFNAGTSKDQTTYIIRLPANKFELWAWIESDRLKNAVFREYYSERDVVMEERRRSYDSQPSGKMYEQLLATAFNAHPYGQPIIGWESDITQLPLKKVQQFWDTWYVPNNAVIVLVGDLDVETVKSTITRYFSAIPARPLPNRISTVEPPQEGERRNVVTFDANPTFFMGFHKPNFPHGDDAVFTVIQTILGDGRSARFPRHIIRDKKVAINVDAWQAPGSRYPNLFVLSGDPRPPHTIADVEQAVWAELERLKTEPVSSDELERAKTKINADFLRELVSHYGMARILAYYEQVTGSWRNIKVETEMIDSVTPEDIKRVANQYFTHQNVSVVTLERRGK
jgi:predicted Zn-dependent peptidase